MKHVILLVSALAITSNACNMTCTNSLVRIASALERIANVMEREHVEIPKQADYVDRTYLPNKQYDISTNGRSLKAIPTSLFNDEEIEECKHNCKKQNKFLSEVEHCIKTECGEE